MDGSGGDDPFDDDAVDVAVGYAIALGESRFFPETTHLFHAFELPPLIRWSCVSGVIFGFHAIILLIVVIVYSRRERQRKVRECLPAPLTWA